MPLLSGPGSVKKNMSELVHGKIGKGRKKAVHTLAKKWGVSEKEARFRQALIISKAKASKKS